MGWKFRTASDADIVRRVLAGKRDDFSVLVERYLSVVQAVAYARTGNRSDAQDVAQDAFLTAFEKLDTVRITRRSWKPAQTRMGSTHSRKPRAGL